MYPAVHLTAHEIVSELVASEAPRGAWVLDCGAGDRHLAERMEARGLRAIAVDPVAGPGIVRARWEGLPFRSGAVAAVTACASLQYAPDPALALQEVARVLRPGGLFVAALSPVHETEAGALKGEATARRRTGNPEYRHFALPQVQGLFAQANLTLEVRPFRVPGRIGTVRRVKSALGVELAEFPTLVGKKSALA